MESLLLPGLKCMIIFGNDPNLVDSYQDGNTSDDDSEDNDVSTERALRGVFQRDGYRMDRFVDDGGKIENEKSDRTFWKKCNNIGRYDWDKDPNGISAGHLKN